MSISNSKAYNALAICVENSPNGIVQKAFVKLYHSMDENHEDETEIVKVLISRLLDGLNFGNWPTD